MLQVKFSRPIGCVFLGKGIEGRPEMGVVCDCREVTFDEWDVVYQSWKGANVVCRTMYRTDNGYSFDQTQLDDGTFRIEEYAPNWRAKKKGAWGL